MLDYYELASRAVNYGAVQKTRELAELLVAIHWNKVRVLVELGSWSGGTAWGFKQIVPRVITIDQNPVSTKIPGVVYLTGDTQSPKTVLDLKTELGGQEIDCLFIDADHSEQGVAGDHKLYSPLVKTGGIVAFHDVSGAPDGADHSAVKRMWESDVADFATAQITITSYEVDAEPGLRGIGYYYKSGQQS